MMQTLFKRKHELFLALIFGSFSLKDDKLYEILYDFAMIEYRHLNWLGTHLAQEKIEFNYDRDGVDFIADTSKELLLKLKTQVEDMKSNYADSDDVMFKRFTTDEEYFIQKIEYILDSNFQDKPITAYDKNRVLEDYDLDKTSTNALTIFLLEETYKEYELIMTYTYVNFFTDSKVLSNIFIDLTYESFFHLKSFARMLSKMGILYMPRVIMQDIYQFDDLSKFLVDGIKEEEMAKIECLKLSQAVENEELSNFFNFINFQENYHIELMQKALKHLKEN
ncbi:MAG TPA: iron-binding protein [Campylobacterales bacterium]|nr:iron-binding protein [Campylobacterales bacterium]